MNHTLCVLGGTGFIGQEIVARLVARGHDVKVPTRNPARYRDMTVLPSENFVCEIRRSEIFFTPLRK